MPRKKNRQADTPMPELNLVPMIDIICTILIFFVVASMTAGKQQAGLKVTLPSVKTPPSATNQLPPDPLIIAIDAQGQFGVKGTAVSEVEMTQTATAFLNKNPQSVVLIQADKKISYEALAKVLGNLQRIGGERVSLAIESN